MKKLMMLMLLPLLAGFFQACSEDDAKPGLLSTITGTWVIENINYQMCQAADCQDDVMEFNDSDLTLVIRKDSVFYFPFVESPEMLNAFAVHTVSGDTLKLRNDAGVWNYVVDEKTPSSLILRGIVPTESDVVFYDIISATR